MKKLNKKGFTLTELVIVIVIIAILAAVLIPSMTGYVNRAKQSSNEQTAESIGTVFAAWLIDETDANGYNGKNMTDFADTYQKVATVKGQSVEGYYTVDTYSEDEANTTNANLTGAINSSQIIDATLAATLKTANGYSKDYSTSNDAQTIEAADVALYNSKLTGAVKKGDFEKYVKVASGAKADGTTQYYTEDNLTVGEAFLAYYLEASENNTKTAGGISDVTVSGSGSTLTASFKYNGGTYTTSASYANGAFTYTSEKN